jgi:hypothetical protein
MAKDAKNTTKQEPATPDKPTLQERPFKEQKDEGHRE